MQIPKYCTDEDLRIWNLGHEAICDGDFEKCRFAIRFGKQAYCGYCPPRCHLHQIIRGQAGCLFCKHATKKLNSAKCLPCLSAETRINYTRVEA